MKVYILVQAAAGAAGSVVDHIGRLKGIGSVEPVIGPWDVIIEAEGHATLGSMSTSLLDEVEKIEGVTRTLTCVAGNL
jgi:hypothetical protein